MAKESISKALEDAHIKYEDIEQVCVGYVYGKLENSPAGGWMDTSQNMRVANF